jgi:hypothetical protein
VPITLLAKLLMPIPIERPRAGVGSVEKLHEPDPFFNQPPGQNAVPGEAGFDGILGSSAPYSFRM